MISPSNLYRRVACPASDRLERALPPEASSEAAERGLRLHAIMARARDAGDAVLTKGLEGEDLEAVEFALETVRPLIDRAIARSALILVEEQVDLTDLGLNAELDPERCRIDLGLVIPGEAAAIIDYKFGYHPGVHPAYDWQFKAYAVAMHRNFGCPTVQVMRLQPALEGGDRIRTATFTEEDLLKFADQIKAATEACEDPEALPVQGAHCRFCAARVTCPARAGAVSYVLPPGADVGPYMASLEPSERASLMEKIQTASEWLADVQKQVEEFIRSGGEVPGWGLVPGRAHRIWMSEEQAEQAIRKLLQESGKDPSLSRESVLLSPAKAEKLLGKSKAIRDAMEPLALNVPGEPKVDRLKT